MFGTTAALTLVGSVISLVDGARRGVGARYRAVAAVFIRKMQADAPVAASALVSLYGLTRREAAVLAGIVDFGGVPETAAILGVTSETVRTPLKSIFCKTGTRRQAELVKLAAGFASPFRSAPTSNG